MQLKAIVAMSSNRVIGRDGDLPWHLPEDLKSFKRLTLGHPIVMGRKTMESLPGGRPLPKRRNVVVSRTLTEAPEGFDLINDLSEIRSELAGHETVFIIGGAEIFKEMLPEGDEFYLTYVFAEYEGDTFLPPFEDDFEMEEIVSETENFEIRRYVKNRRD